MISPMEIFKIVKDTNPRLRERCAPFEMPISEETKKMFFDMLEYLKLSQDDEFLKKHKQVKSGVGLACPQIGVYKQGLAIYYIDEEDLIHEYILVNPKIISESAKLCYLENGEGCLSVDNPHGGYVYRPYKIKVRAFDLLRNEEVIYDFKGYEAIVVQHEIDHLKGILFYDHINKVDPFEKKPGSVAF